MKKPPTLYRPYTFLEEGPTTLVWMACRDHGRPTPRPQWPELVSLPHELGALSLERVSAQASAVLEELMCAQEIQALDRWLVSRLGWRIDGASAVELPLPVFDVDPTGWVSSCWPLSWMGRTLELEELLAALGECAPGAPWELDWRPRVVCFEMSREGYVQERRRGPGTSWQAPPPRPARAPLPDALIPGEVAR